MDYFENKGAVTINDASNGDQPDLRVDEEEHVNAIPISSDSDVSNSATASCENANLRALEL
jgi:hypothetical protein